MAKITLNDHLDDMMERLMSEDISSENLEKEIKRAEALCNVAAMKIEDKKVGVQFVRYMSQGQISPNMIPTSLVENHKQISNGNNS